MPVRLQLPLLLLRVLLLQQQLSPSLPPLQPIPPLCFLQLRKLQDYQHWQQLPPQAMLQMQLFAVGQSHQYNVV
jgi:hypothetical protein